METTFGRPVRRMIPADRVLDLRGLPNPEPILELAEVALSLNDGETVRILSDDSRFAADFVRWAGGSDLQILSLGYPADNLTELILRRPMPRSNRKTA